MGLSLISLTEAGVPYLSDQETDDKGSLPDSNPASQLMEEASRHLEDLAGIHDSVFLDFTATSDLENESKESKKLHQIQLKSVLEFIDRGQFNLRVSPENVGNQTYVLEDFRGLQGEVPTRLANQVIQKHDTDPDLLKKEQLNEVREINTWDGFSNVNALKQTVEHNQLLETFFVDVKKKVKKGEELSQAIEISAEVRVQRLETPPIDRKKKFAELEKNRKEQLQAEEQSQQKLYQEDFIAEAHPEKKTEALPPAGWVDKARQLFSAILTGSGSET